jgi:hypothetical protein
MSTNAGSHSVRNEARLLSILLLIFILLLILFLILIFLLILLFSLDSPISHRPSAYAD